MKILILIPTYNEKDNILPLISDIRASYPGCDILVIDDSSPDGTYRLVERLSLKESRIKLLLREKRKGLGAALFSGYKYAFSNHYDKVVQIDGDYSHPVKYIKEILTGLDMAGLVVCSRNISGGGSEDWALFRILLSRLAGSAAKSLLGLGAKDPTSGFRGFSKDFIASLVAEYKPISKGYLIQVETVLIAKAAGYGVLEIPFIYRKRRSGASKLGIIETFKSGLVLVRLILKRYN
ncbi:MAG TPA: glycosyltransferase [Candidatus Omnitrophica bacterium]|nr:glycosyltransferase [Candidatus Omnitrophota bacterium]